MRTEQEQMEHYRMRAGEVLVDVDGTLTEFRYPKLGPPRPGAKEFIEWLIARGLRPVIWSSRLSKDNAPHPQERYYQMWAIWKWMESNGFPVNECGFDNGDFGKRLALCYVDDRGVACDSDTSWRDVRARVTEIQDREMAKWKEYDDARRETSDSPAASA